MNELSSSSFTDDKEENSVGLEEFYRHYESLLDTSTTSSLPTADANLSLQTHTLLPFKTQPNTAAIFPIEPKNEENL
jgi:hypothetical protein